MKEKILKFIKAFGLFNTYRLLIRPQIISIFTKKNISLTSRKEIRSFLLSEIFDIVKKYKKSNITDFNNSSIEQNYPIWICWWQGKEDMPDLCKLCLNYVLKNSAGHPIIVIDKDNYKDYVNLPEIFFLRLNNKEISITHFTDVLRFNLLNQRGGMWLDAAILMLKPLDLNNFSFYSNRNEEKDDIYISKYRWTGGVLASCPNSIVTRFVVDAYNYYWEKYDTIISFMLMDYLLDIGYEEVPAIREIIDKIPFTNPDFYSLKPIFNKEVNMDIVNLVMCSSSLLSLNRRLKYSKVVEKGHQTYYGYFNSMLI